LKVNEMPGPSDTENDPTLFGKGAEADTLIDAGETTRASWRNTTASFPPQFASNGAKDARAKASQEFRIECLRRWLLRYS